jgi:hypothetical protein
VSGDCYACLSAAVLIVFLMPRTKKEESNPGRHPGMLVLSTLEEPTVKINTDRFQPENKSRLLLTPLVRFRDDYSLLHRINKNT